MISNKRALIILAIVTALFIALPVDAQTIFACLNQSSGKLGTVAVDVAPACSTNETLIQWNVEGTTGPEGPSGPAGPAGPEGPPGEAGTPSPKFEFVGLSARTFDGDGGIINMNQSCAAKFPASRLCNSKEILETVDPPSPPMDFTAWVQPLIINFAAAEEGAIALDHSGKSAPVEELSCSGWSTTGGRGLTLNSFGSDIQGAFGLLPCSASAPATCCALSDN